MSDRKYRHRGYMDNNQEPQRQQRQQPKQQSKPVDREGPRSPKMMAFGETVKCSACGAKAPPSITLESTCPNCRAELHTASNSVLDARMSSALAQHTNDSGDAHCYAPTRYRRWY